MPWSRVARVISPLGWNAVLAMHNLVALAANALQVYGVLVWHWDTFQILMLFWLETLIVGFWALMRIAIVPSDQLGEITINGRAVAATHKMMMLLVGPLFAAIAAAHLLFLWVIFSGRWSDVVHGPVSFVSEFIDKPEAWIPLLSTFIAGAIGYLRYSSLKKISEGATQIDGFGDAVGAPFGRIAILQVAIILGAILSQKAGSTTPWLILICIKTLFDYRQPNSAKS